MVRTKKLIATLLSVLMFFGAFGTNTIISNAAEVEEKISVEADETSNEEVPGTEAATEESGKAEEMTDVNDVTESVEIIETDEIITDEVITEELTEATTEEKDDLTEETTDDTTEDIYEESPKLFIRMTEGGSVRFNNATYYVEDNILYKDTVYYADTNDLGYFEITDDIDNVKLIALSEHNGTITDFRISNYDNGDFITYYQTNSGDDCCICKDITIIENTYVDINFLPGEYICESIEPLKGAASKYINAIPSLIGKGFISNYPTRTATDDDPKPDVSDGTTTRGTFEVLYPTSNIDTPVTFKVKLHGGLLDGLVLQTTCSSYGANNIYKNCAVNGDSYVATASVSGSGATKNTVWTISTGNESYPCVWLQSENRWGHGFQTSKGYYQYSGNVTNEYIYLTVKKLPTEAHEGDDFPSTAGIKYDLVDGLSKTPFVEFTLGDNGYAASISCYMQNNVFMADASTDSYLVYLGPVVIDGVLFANFQCHNMTWFEGIFEFVETQGNENYEIEKDENGNPVYHRSPAVANNITYIEYLYDDEKPADGAIQILKVDQFGNSVSGAEYTLYKDGSPFEDASGSATKTTSSDANKKGLATFYGLPNGTYTVKETKVPDSSYELDNKEYTVTINTAYTIRGYSYSFDYNYYYNNETNSTEHGLIEGGWGAGKYGYFSHWYRYGCNEGRRGNATFNPLAYAGRYSDIRNTYGTSYIQAANHYNNSGAKENRKTLTDDEYNSLSNQSVTGNSTGLVIIKSLDPTPRYVYVKKQTKSNCNKLVENNVNYSLSGAKFKMFKDINCNQPLTSNAYDFVTDANGNTVALDVSSYMTSENLVIYVKEIEASKGYKLNEKPERVVVTKDNNKNNPAVVTINEIPMDDPSAILVTKKDNEEDNNYRTLYLQGAIFEVKYYAAESEGQINNNTYRKRWYIKTDSNGKARLNDDYLIKSFGDSSSDDYYYNNEGYITFPLGYITIQEVKAPEGYILDDRVTIQKVVPNMDEVTRENLSIRENDEKKQPFSIIKLADDGTTELKPLSHAGFMACRIEELEIDEKGNYIFDKTKAVYLTDTEKEMFTDDDGNATSIPLRYGTYMVKETTVPVGYQEAEPFFVTVTEDKPAEPQAIRFITDKEQHFYIRIVKYDKVTGKPIIKNNSTYKVWSYDKNKYLSFRTYNGSKYVKKSEFTTDDESVLILPEALSFGRYRLDEITAPEGYNIDSPNGIPFTIDENTAYQTYKDEDDTQVVGIINVPVTDTQIYGRYELIKKGEIREFDEEANDFVTDIVPLKDIEFGIYADENIYTSDGTNTLIYTKNELVFTIITDENGCAYQDNIPLGKYMVKELNTPDDYIKVDDKSIEFSLSEKKTDASGKYYVEQTSEFLNRAYYPKVETTALDSKTNEHTGVVGTIVTVVDKVDCSDMVIGREYTIKGILYDTTTKKPYIDNNGKFVTAEKTFTATAKKQTVNLEFTYDTTDLKGETITVFETMYYNNQVVALHVDINDTEQQIHYPDVKTTALDRKTNTHTGVVDEKATVIDKVACTNLVIGKEYTIKGKLYNTETGGAVIDNGKEITSEKTFIAEENNPVIELEFTFNSKNLQNETIVVFEDLYHNDVKVSSHSDLEDKEQQISYPKVGTKAVDKDTDSKSGVTGKVATIVDTVDCSNLVIGQIYTVKGKLYDTASGEVFLDNGVEVTSEQSFTAINKNMTVELTFTFDSTSLEGKTTTVFEDLYTENIKVASHSDINDKEQQVDYPQVRTTAKDKATDSHTGTYAEKATIIDSVECTNLVVGKEYTVKGILYNAETGEIFLDGGKEVTAELTFVADKKEMVVELEFVFNSTSLVGETIVVFEDLYHKNIKVDSHARLDDKDQQVHYPGIKTTAKNAVDGGKTSEPKSVVTLNDTVVVSNVGVGDKFILRGVIYDKTTGEKLIIDSNEVWSYTEFISQEKDFKMDVVFIFNASDLAGKDIVIYEYLYLVKPDGTEILITTHEDINDIGQTIKFTPPTPKTGDDISKVLYLMISALGIMVVMILGKRIIRKRR